MYVHQSDTYTIEEAYEHLAKSIVIQAIDEYRKILHTTKYNKTTHKHKKELEKFFRSDWCYLLSGWDGEYLMELIQEQEGVLNV